jgi:fumarate hydratase class II
MLIDLINELKKLEKSFTNISNENKSTYKIGRTHLQDAVPMTIKQEFSAFAEQIHANVKRLKMIESELDELPIGGTAIGTMLTSDKKFPALVCQELNKSLNMTFKPSKNKFKDIATKDTQVFLMGILSTISVSLIKIANDLRLLSSGPKTGFGEISFKKLQSGSSIMPGKVNPVMAESMIQVGAFVIGKNSSVIIAGQNAPLQLNMMMPLIAHETTESLRILTKGIKAFRESGVDNIVINKEKALSWVEMSSELITSLIHHPKIGYDLATKLVNEADKRNMTIKQYLMMKKILSDKEIEELLNIKKMVSL